MLVPVSRQEDKVPYVSLVILHLNDSKITLRDQLRPMVCNYNDYFIRNENRVDATWHSSKVQAIHSPGFAD